MRDDPAVIDGSLGFDDPMEMDNGSTPASTSGFTNGNGNGRQPPRGPAADTGGLYSDKLVRNTNRRGRGFGRGRGW